MVACLILLSALVVVGTILRLFHKSDIDAAPGISPSNIEEGCCGTHAICEKKNVKLLSPVEYYDDEELDRFAGRDGDNYEPDEVEEFREVLTSLLPSDVEGWGISLQQRGITLPYALRDEYMILIADGR